MKVLNQQLYTSYLYGGETNGGSLIIESTSHLTKGPIQLRGTQFELSVGGQLGVITHSNTGTRNYLLPNISGTIIVSGVFNAPGQLLYSTGSGVTSVLTSLSNGALTTDASGLPLWSTGSEGQILTVSSTGAVGFFDPPDIGTIGSGSANTIPIYKTPGPSNDLISLTTINGRALLSDPSGLGWFLITAPYLQTTGSVALPTGTSGQVLAATGDGSFAWTNPSTGVVNYGSQYYLPYYSTSPSGQTVSQSAFISTDETARILKLENAGRLRFYEATAGGTNSITFKAPNALSVDTSYNLPPTDGVYGSVLTTDGSGNLTFIYTDNGTVTTSLSGQIAYYPVDGNDVQGLTTVSSRVLGAGPQWILITAPYLSAPGGVPLGAGASNQVLISNGLGNFSWANASDINGEVLSGVQNRLAFYPSTGTKVDDVPFITVSSGANTLSLWETPTIQLNTSSSQYIGLTIPSSLSVSKTYVLPFLDGSFGQVLSTDGSGNLAFMTAGSGTVHTGQSSRLAYYISNNDELWPLDNTSSRVLMTTVGSDLNWSLITSPYLSTTGGLPLAPGTTGYVLISEGSNGNFLWSDPATLVGKINPGVVTRIPYYSAGNELDDSSFLQTNESNSRLEILGGGSLALFETTSSSSIALKAPTTLSASLQFSLPLSYGLSGQVLDTDGSGGLAWHTASGTVGTGASGTIAVYTDASAVVGGVLYPPTSLPGQNNSGLIVDTSGSVQYQMLVEPSGSQGQMAYYSGSQTVTNSSHILYSGPQKTLSLLDQASLRCYDTGSSQYVSIKAPTSVSSSYSLTFPEVGPSAGQTFESDSSGNLTFVTPGDNASQVQKGSINIPDGAEEVTIVFPTPFASTPKTILAQWSITDTDLPSFLPTIGVDQKSREGFVVKFSTTTPPVGVDYVLYWEAFLNGNENLQTNVFFAGGNTSGGLTTDILSLFVDVDTAALGTPASLTTARGYATATASATAGRILGGQEGVASVDKISSYTYITSTLADLVATLVTPRSKASGVGSRDQGYIIGGETIGSGNLASIEKIVHATDTVSTISSTLANDVTGKGAAHSLNDTGYIVENTANCDVEILSFSTDSLSASPNNFGVSGIQVGTNDAMKGVGYFANAAGLLWSYDFTTDTITSLTVNLTSSSGLSAAGNSMRKSYFAGDLNIESLFWKAETVGIVNTLPTSYSETSSCAFQTNGLL